MEVYWRDGEPWQDYLQRKTVIEGNPIESHQLGREIPRTTNSLTDTVELPSTQTSSELDRISSGIAGLQSEFDMTMGKELWKLQMRQETLHEILAELRLAEFEREARAFRQRAEEAYINGWYEEALSDFLEAEKRNDRDFSVLRAVGNIYLYEQIDLDKALAYFERCAKYAAAYSKEHAAEALMFAAWTCYLRRDDAAAIAHTQHAFQMNSDLTEALYYHAKFAGAIGNTTLALPSLEQTIRIDRNYWSKAENDRDFDAIRSEVQNLYNRLYDEVKAEAQSIFDPREILDAYHIEPCPETEAFSKQLSETADLFSQATTYFDYLDLVPTLKQCREMFDTLKGYSEIAILEGHTNWIRSIDFSGDGKLLASASSDQTIRLWDVDTRQQTAEIEGDTKDVTSISFSPDGKLLVSGSGDQTVRLWSVATKQQVTQLRGHTDWIRSVAASPDGKLLASASEDQTVRLWDVAAKRQVAQLGGRQEEGLQFWDIDSVFSVAFSPDGRLLAGGARDLTVRLWDVTTKRQVARLEGHTGWVHAVAFSPDGQLLASGARDNVVRLWDVETKRTIAQFEGHTGWVHGVAFSPDAGLLASVSEDKTVRLWDVTTGTQVAQLEGHAAWVHTVDFSPNGRILASGSGDGTIRLWGINFVIPKAQKAEEERRLQASAERRHRQAEAAAQKVLDGARLSLSQAVSAGAAKHAAAELQSARGILEQAESAFDEGNFDGAKSQANRARSEAVRVKELTENRILAEERRRNGQCVVCGRKLGLFKKLGGNERCKAHR